MPDSAWFSASTVIAAYRRYSGSVILGRQFQPSGKSGSSICNRKAPVDDRLILLMHDIGDGVDEFLVALVVLVCQPMFDRAGRIGGEERLRNGDTGDGGF